MTGYFSLTAAFQSTLPREERLFFPFASLSVTAISIHAPTRGATVQQTATADVKRISIHAPTRGATGAELDKACEEIHFNPRSHERSDQNPGSLVNSATISIHAPTRGATTTLCHAKRSFIFQSTLPREERPA